MNRSVATFLMIAIVLISLNGCGEENSSEDFFCYGTSFIHKNNTLTKVKEEKRTYSVSQAGITDYECNFSERTILCRKDIKSFESFSSKELIINRKFNFAVEIDTLYTGVSSKKQPSETIFEAKCDKSFL